MNVHLDKEVSMEKILFEYPYFIYREEDPEDSVIVQRQASIRSGNLTHEPCDAYLNNGENSYHLIFGKQINGNFLCIPDWFIGCEIASYDNIEWNESSLSEAVYYNGRLDYNDVSAICYALKTIKPYLK